MTPKQARSQLIALLMVTSLLALGFHHLGSNALFAFEWSPNWIAAAEPENALAAMLRLSGLLGCYWVLASTTLYALIKQTGRSPLAIRWTTAPLIRRLVDSSLVVSLALATLAVPAQPVMATEDPERAIVLEIHSDGIPVPHLKLGSMSPSAAESEPTIETVTTATPSPPPHPSVATTTNAESHGEPGVADSYVVVPGDNLWRVAAAQVEAVGPSETTERMIATYWRQLIEANIASLRSGDPNLIYPGEILALPRLEELP
jgi:nucleoid-associated protein YgaU